MSIFGDRSGPLLLDGAMGTELQRAGLPPGEAGELWNLRFPEKVLSIHKAYLDAGSDIIITNSFQANRWALSRHGFDGVEAANSAAARIAREAAGPAGVVLGDIGPFGGLLAPLGEVGVAEIGQEFQRQAEALLEAGVDGIIVETMTALEEAVAAVEAARRAGARDVLACMSFDRMRDGRMRTVMGISPERAARALADAGASAVGANCGTRLTVEDFAGIAALMREAVELPLISQPNAGQPELDGDSLVYNLSPEAFSEGIGVVMASGATIVGGCCGTTPAHIHAVRSLLASMDSSP
jgi:5-methyltetrahydrofolate--homocysteine methyltransferase